METPKTTHDSAPNPAGPASTKAPIEQLRTLAEVRRAVPEWLTCMMQCNKEVESNRQVIVVGCGHIICSKACLNEWREKYSGYGEKMHCPLCTLEIRESVLENKMTVKEAFPFKPTKDNVTLICGICVFDNEAVSYCSACSSYLCEECDELHPTIRLTQAHKVTRDLSERKKFELDRWVSEHSICKGHADEPEPPPADAIAVTHNCKRCRLRICKHCAENHIGKSHEVVDVGALRGRLINQMKETAELLSLVEIGRERLEQKKIQMEDGWGPIFADVNSEFSVFVGKATKQCLDQKKDVSGLYENATNEIDRRLKKLQIHGEQINRYIQVTKSVLDEGDNHSVLHVATHLSPLAAKLTEATNALKDYENFTLRRHKFVIGSTWSSDAAELLEEFAEVNYTNPAYCPAFSLALDGSLTESARLTNDHGMDKTLELLKKATKDLVEERKKEEKEKAVKKATEEEATKPNAEETAAKKATEEEAIKPNAEESAAKKATEEEAIKPNAEESAAKKATEEEATIPNAEETAAKKATEEEAIKPNAEETAAKKATEEEAIKPNAEESAAKKATEATTKKPEREAQKQMSGGGIIKMEGGTDAESTNEKRGEKRKMDHGGNIMAKKQEIRGRSRSPSMPKLKRQVAPNLPVVIPRKSGRQTVVPSKFSIYSLNSLQESEDEEEL